MTSILRNKIFISTRPKDESDELISRLTNMGAHILKFPLIEIKAAEIPDYTIQYFKKPDQFEWIIFTSSNGVHFFFKKLKEISGTQKLAENIKLAVIGKKTEAVLNLYGYEASFVNPGSTAEEFAPAFLLHIRQSKTSPKILLTLGNLARDVIQDHIRDFADCIRIDIYKNTFPSHVDAKIINQIIEGHYDLLLFTSPSGIRNFKKLFPELSPGEVRMACIGVITEREAILNGFNPLVTAQSSTAEGLAESVINYYLTKK